MWWELKGHLWFVYLPVILSYLGYPFWKKFTNFIKPNMCPFLDCRTVTPWVWISWICSSSPLVYNIIRVVCDLVLSRWKLYFVVASKQRLKSINQWTTLFQFHKTHSINYPDVNSSFAWSAQIHFGSFIVLILSLLYVIHCSSLIISLIIFLPSCRRSSFGLLDKKAREFTESSSAISNKTKTWSEAKTLWINKSAMNSFSKICFSVSTLNCSFLHSWMKLTKI